MYEVLDDTAAQTILAIEGGDSIRRVAQHLHTPYETVREAVNRLEDAGYVSYDGGLNVVDERVRDAARARRPDSRADRRGYHVRGLHALSGVRLDGR